MRTWQLQEAKNRFSQVVDEALDDGPQMITRRGVEVAIILSAEQYRKLTAREQKLSTFFGNSPLSDVELDLDRDTSPIRDEFVL